VWFRGIVGHIPAPYKIFRPRLPPCPWEEECRSHCREHTGFFLSRGFVLFLSLFFISIGNEHRRAAPAIGCGRRRDFEFPVRPAMVIVRRPAQPGALRGMQSGPSHRPAEGRRLGQARSGITCGSLSESGAAAPLWVGPGERLIPCGSLDGRTSPRCRFSGGCGCHCRLARQCWVGEDHGWASQPWHESSKAALRARTPKGQRTVRVPHPMPHQNWGPYSGPFLALTPRGGFATVGERGAGGASCSLEPVTE
jgi:hypothetical protein